MIFAASDRSANRAANSIRGRRDVSYGLGGSDAAVQRHVEVYRRDANQATRRPVPQDGDRGAFLGGERHERDVHGLEDGSPEVDADRQVFAVFLIVAVVALSAGEPRVEPRRVVRSTRAARAVPRKDDASLAAAPTARVVAARRDRAAAAFLAPRRPRPPPATRPPSAAAGDPALERPRGPRARSRAARSGTVAAPGDKGRRVFGKAPLAAPGRSRLRLRRALRRPPGGPRGAAGRARRRLLD